MLVKEVRESSEWNVSMKKSGVKKEQRSNSYRTHIRDIDKRSTARERVSESCFYECVCAYAPAYYRKTHGCFNTHSLAHSLTLRRVGLCLTLAGTHNATERKVDQRTIFSVSIRRRCRCWWAKLQRARIEKQHTRTAEIKRKTEIDRKKLASVLVRLWKFWNSKASISATHTNSNHDTYANQQTGTTF